MAGHEHDSHDRHPSIDRGWYHVPVVLVTRRSLAVSGIVQSSGEVRGNALYEVRAGTVRQLSDDAGGGGSLKRQEIAVKLPFPPDGERSIAAFPDGRTLYYGARQVEAKHLEGGAADGRQAIVYGACL